MAVNPAVVESWEETEVMSKPGQLDLGEWDWLRVFEAEDLQEFICDIQEAVILGAQGGSTDLLEERLRAWRVTAEQANDPLFRSILRGGISEADFVEVGRPES